MTAFKKSENVQTPLMAKSERTIIRLPNGDVQVDPFGRKDQNDKFFREILKGDEVKYDYFTDKVSSDASRIITEFLLDMYRGKNMAKTKKPRSINSVYGYRTRLPSIVSMLEKHSKRPLLELTEDDVLLVFNKMRDGIILTQKGQPFKDTQSYAKFFCSFWRWRMRVLSLQKKDCPDLVKNIDLSRDKKPIWTYFDFEQVKEMADMAPSLYYKALVLFLFDSGIRPPKELMNVRVKDLSPIPNSDNLFLEIRNETAKTFGRKIKLMICSRIIKKFIKLYEKKADDFLFDKGYDSMRRMVKQLGHSVLKLGTRDKDKSGHIRITGGIKLYDFRHCSVCHYLPLYKSENQMKYRYGWKRAEMIHYYSEYMGMVDTIEEGDMFLTENKVGMQLEVEKEKEKVLMMQEQLAVQKKEMDEKMQKMEAMMMQRFAENY